MSDFLQAVRPFLTFRQSSTEKEGKKNNTLARFWLKKFSLLFLGFIAKGKQIKVF